MIDDPRDDRYPGDGWGGEDEGTRRIDDCIDEVSFGVDDDEGETGGRR
jgi:hypothetical protein